MTPTPQFVTLLPNFQDQSASFFNPFLPVRLPTDCPGFEVTEVGLEIELGTQSGSVEGGVIFHSAVPLLPRTSESVATALPITTQRDLTWLRYLARPMCPHLQHQLRDDLDNFLDIAAGGKTTRGL
jgi:hypothetical protein